MSVTARPSAAAVPDERRPLRIVLAVVAALEMAVLVRGVLEQATEARLRGAPVSALVGWLARAPVLVAVAAAGVGAAVGFARRPGQVAWALAAVGALGLLEHTQAALFIAGHQHAYFAVGAMLIGWVVGLVFTRGAGAGVMKQALASVDESLAEAGAIAGLAAVYVDAGVSKLATAGWTWTDATTLRSAILANDPIDDTSPLTALSRLVVEHDGLARALSIATVIVQAGAFVYVFGPRARMLWGTLLLAFHASVALTTPILYFYNCVLLLAFSYPWARLLRRRKRAAVEGGDAGAGAVLTAEQTRAVALGLAPWLALAVVAAWVGRALGVLGP